MADGKWISDLEPQTPLADAARRVLGVRLEVVRDHLGLALREPDKDAEHVHQLRVGTRRAGAALDIFALCLPDKTYRTAREQLRRLRRAAGGARDWDVFLADLAAAAQRCKPTHRPGFDFLIGHAQAQRQLAQVDLEEASPDYPFAFERFLTETLAAVHRPHSPPGPRTLSQLARPLLTGLLRDLDRAAAQDLEDYDNLHQVRIVGKRLRYAMEVLADCFAPAFKQELYPRVEAMQDILGGANDSHVAAQRLTALRDHLRKAQPKLWKRYQPGVEGLLRSHQQRLPAERRAFLEWWESWQQSGTEAALGQLLQESAALRR